MCELKKKDDMKLKDEICKDERKLADAVLVEISFN